jgi:integrase
MNPPERRSYGTGSLLIHIGAGGKETWYGRWRVGKKRVKRRIGPKRKPGGRTGLTRTQAEAELRRLMVAERAPLDGDEVSLTEAAEHMLRHLEALERKPTTLENYRSLLRTHLAPRLGDIPIDQVTSRQVEELATEMQHEGKAAKTRSNALKLLSQIFTFAKRRGWCRQNPCELVGRPQVEQSSDIHFLNQDELEALLASVDTEAEPFGHTDFAIFLTAAMSGLRQSELLALRWRDVDWSAQKIRVRRNYVRGHLLTPKSKRGSRSVPLASRVAAELKRHFERSLGQEDEDLVFAHPDTGKVLAHSSLVQRFKKALKAASVREIRFNDLRHTFGTRMAAAGVPMRTLQEWMGHRDFRTTLIYADYAPGDDESGTVDEAFE